MAKKTSSRSAASSSGDSNSGLIIALVFFVLATLTLGVFVYFGYDGKFKAEESAKTAAAATAKANKDRDAEKFKYLMTAIAAGTANPAEVKELANVRSAGNADEMVKKFSLDWKTAQDRPAETYLDLIARLRTERANADKARQDAENGRRADKAEFDASVKNLSDRVNQANANLTTANNKALEDLKKEQEGYLKRIDDINGVSKSLTEEKQGRADEVTAIKREKTLVEESRDSTKKQLEIAKSKIDPLSSIESDTPKGQILRVDREAGMVYVNLGSADYLRPGVSFSIFAAGSAAKTTSKREPKGQIEVVNILEPHMSMARVTMLVNGSRDPLITGDLIFNPSWSPSQRDHIALAGIFDIDGDGTDDTAEVIRNLERQGIIVDAWLDLRERVVKGRGITERTSYLVLGERPELSPAVARQAAQMGDNPLIQGMMQINQLIAKMETDAKDRGVDKVNYRRYLTLIGYQMPKLSRPIDTTLSSYIRAAAPAATPAAPASPPKEKEEK